jgi:hypothetical protein
MITLALVTVAGLTVACGDDDDGGTATTEATPSPTATRLPFEPTPSPTPPPTTTEAGMELREFVIAPDRTRARPGTVIFKPRNAGELTHQFLVIRSDLPIAELPRKPGNTGVDETQLDVVGRIDAILPGESDEVTVPAELGDYVLICNLFAEGKSHYLSGMYNSFEVTLTAPDPLMTPQPSSTLSTSATP